LAEVGARVTLIDSAAPGGGTSANSFAWVNANAKRPRSYFRLNFESMAAHRRLVEAVRGVHGEAAWLHETGGLEWTDSEAGRERLLTKAARLKEWGYAIEVVDEGEVRRLEPHMRTAGLTAATFCPEEGWMDGPLFCRGVAGAVQRLGATVRIGEEVVALERDGGRVIGVRLSGGDSLRADHVLIAAGRWTDRVAALAGVRVPLAPTSGLLAVTGPLDARVSRVVYAPGMNFRPDPTGGLVLQSGETDAMVSADTPPDPALPGCDQLLQRVSRFLPAAAIAGIAAARVGTRPMPADGLSVVGPVPGRAGLYLSLTHSGITLAPLLAELAAAELTTGAEDARLADFRPARCVTVA
jgi:glycine/D-amino acid oxidase-like deaminating enzyme